MSEEQVALAGVFNFVVPALRSSGFDWNVGVVTTDMDRPERQGRLVQVGGEHFVTRDTPHAVAALGEAIMVGILGSADEQGRAAVYTALELLGSEANRGFLRPGGQLAVAVLSDEQDHSGGIKRREFIRWLGSLATNPGDVSFSSIVTPPNNCPTGYEPGTKYLSVTEAVGGVRWSICETEYLTPLVELLALHHPRSPWWELNPRLVDPATIEVERVRGRVALTEDQWRWDEGVGAIVVFDVAAKEGDVFEVRYR